MNGVSAVGINNSCAPLNNSEGQDLLQVYITKHQPAQDSFVLTNKPAPSELYPPPPTKRQLSNKAKILIGAGAAALAIGIGFLIKRKIDSKAVKTLAEHIEFTPAESIQEAIKFGKEHLGIKKYRGFESTDLDVLNWAHEGLVQNSNVARGKVKMPKCIVYDSEFLDANTIAGVITGQTGKLRRYNGVLFLNKNILGNINAEIAENLASCEKVGLWKILEGGKIAPEQMTDTDSVRELIKTIERFNGGNMSYKEKVGLNVTLKDFSETFTRLIEAPAIQLEKFGMPKDEVEKFIKLPIEKQKRALANFIIRHKDQGKLKIGVAKKSPFQVIHHEMGHLQDTVERCQPTGKFDSPDKYPKELKDWLSNTINIQAANSVSPYAATGPGEFIAEAYAKKVSGEPLSEAAEKLYKELQGPII